MNGLSKIGLVLAILCAAFAAYLQFVVVPALESAASTVEMLGGMDMYDDPAYIDAFTTSEKAVDYGMYLMLAAGVAFLVCLVPVFKKNKLAMLGAVIALAAFFVGAAHGSHMFS